MERDDGRRANEACSATAPVRRWTVSRHKGPAYGDPGSGDETEAGRGGLGALKEVLEEPPTTGGGPRTKDTEARTGR